MTDALKSGIRNIRWVHSSGAFGDPNKWGTYIYGRRGDGKTVRCKSHWDESAGMTIESRGHVTNFTADEWNLIRSTPSEKQMVVSNKILDQRAPKP